MKSILTPSGQFSNIVEKEADVSIKVNCYSLENHTALPCEASRGRCEKMKFLIKNDARINDETSFDDSALIKPSEKHHHSVVKLLLSKGADAEHQNFAEHGTMCAAIAYSMLAQAVCCLLLLFLLFMR